MENTLIKIVSGAYGCVNEKGTVERKTTESPPFYVSEKEAKRLVKLNVAERVMESGILPNEEDTEGLESYNSDMTFKELQAFAKDNGVLGYENAKSKSVILKFLNDYFQKNGDNNCGDGENPPVLNAGGAE